MKIYHLTATWAWPEKFLRLYESCKLRYLLSLVFIIAVLQIVIQYSEIFITTKVIKVVPHKMVEVQNVAKVKVNEPIVFPIKRPGEKYQKLDYYLFDKVMYSFGEVDLAKISDFTKEEFLTVMGQGVPNLYRKNFTKILPKVMKIAVDHQVDPFWVLAVMWTESHFLHNSRSYANAFGLMQIMPDTAHYLTKKMKRPVSKKKAQKLIRDEEINIEMGVFYLNQLLKSFSYNYRLATVAYNMGPGNVHWRLKNRLEVGRRNLYLNKVRRAYRYLVKHYNMTLRILPKPHELTYVVKIPKKRYSLEQFDLYPEGLPSNILWISPELVKLVKVSFL